MNGKLDVEVHNGKVVAVWHKCLLLPFEQVDIDDARAAALDARPSSDVITAVYVERAAVYVDHEREATT